MPHETAPRRSQPLPRSAAPTPRRICFVTGTRAEFGLMETALRAIRGHSRLQLQLIATGMHLDRRHGRSIDEIGRRGWRIDRVVPWPAGNGSPADVADRTGRAIS